VKSAGTVISDGAHAAGEVERGTLGDQAAKIVDTLAVSPGQYFAAQNWIAASATPSQLP
jgi:hypothetical protein